jgi:hypothetical protein
LIDFLIDHPFLSLGAAAWLVIVVFGWLFIAGAAIASGKN